MDYKKLGSRIREERLKMNMTQSQLAEASSISDTFMGAIERGERGLALDTLVAISNTLGVSVDYLLSDSVDDSDSNIVSQFKQLIANKPMKKQQMAIGVLKTMFSYMDENDTRE